MADTARKHEPKKHADPVAPAPTEPTPAPAQPADPPWVVYTYATIGGRLVCHVYGTKTGTGQPFTEATAQAYAAGLTGVTAMVLPVEVGP